MSSSSKSQQLTNFSLLSFVKTHWRYITMVVFGLAAIAAISVVGVHAKSFANNRDDFITRIDKQYAISVQGVRDNIGPNGAKAPGVPAGVMIASPSTQDPDYFFTWARDSGLTMKMVTDEFIQGNSDVRKLIQEYLQAQAVLQTLTSHSGTLSTGKGLGEPKFFTNLTRFDGPWGRPQRDGPALRATALLTYARWLLDTGRPEDTAEAKDKIWPVVRNDLTYVAQYWNETGFDLWEETLGSSFFTTAVQHRALVEGAAIGRRLGQPVSAYESQAPNVLCFLQSFWNGRHAVANTNTEEGFKRTGIDANSILASIASFDPEAQCDDSTFQPCSARALANLKVYVDSFRTIYPINHGIPQNTAVATGRYTEDVYFGGHPWYLTTLAVAEQLYDAIQQWTSLNSITISDLDLGFWKDVYSGSKIGTYKGDNQEFRYLSNAVLSFADGFIKVALNYTPPTGALSEQFSRDTGAQVSARDLTWSYAAFITTRAARLAATSDFPQVPSWGGDKANKPPAVCKADSVPGLYQPAISRRKRYVANMN